MKNVLWIFVLMTFAVACSGPSNEYHVTGNLDGATPGWVVLSKVEDNNLVPVDSVETTDGSFSFTGHIDMPESYFLQFKADNRYHRFFIEPGAEIVISGKLEEPKIEGSKTQDIYEDFKKGIADLDDQRNTIYKDFRTAMNEKDTAKLEEIQTEAQKIDDQQHQFTTDFVKEHSNSVVGPYVTVNNIYQFDLDELKDLRSGFSAGLDGTKYVNIIDEQISKLEDVAIGQTAPLFTQNDTGGNPVSLEQFRGNYLLIDFWASWCSPCRQENPNVVLAYQKYHDKGFNILGVSLDKDETRWLDAIDADNLTWTQVSDLKGWQNEASNLYGVSSIPANFLLDPDGVIVAKDLRGEDLQEKLHEIYD